MSSSTAERQSSITRDIHEWMLRHGLSSPQRAAAIAPVIATFGCRCAPHERDLDVTEQQGYWFAAMFLALFWGLDHLDVQDEAGRDTLDQIRRSLGRDGGPAGARNSWPLAVSELLDTLRGMEGRAVEVFAAAFADHLDAVEEKLLARLSTHGAAGAPGGSELPDLCDRIDGFLRLRPLLVATEPYLRGWQTVLDLWPAPAFASTVASLAPDVRREHPNPLLDRALDLARLAHARPPGRVARRRSPALSELDALTVAMTYLANDLGSVDRDRSAGGPEQEPNLVLHLERYLLARSNGRVRPCPWDHGPRPLPPAELAAAITVDMYDAAVGRLQTLVRLLLGREHDINARRYLYLLIRIVDGNLQGTLDHTRGRALTASTREPAPAGQEIAPRYGSVPTLMRLRFVDEAARSVEPQSGGV